MNRKLCFLQHDLGGGGAERKVCTLANFFVNEGYTVEIGLFGNDRIAYKLDPRIQTTLINRDSYSYRNIGDKIVYDARKTASTAFVCFPAMMAGAFLRMIHSNLHTRVSYDKAVKHFEHQYDYIEPIKAFVKNRKDYIFITMMSQTFIMVMDVISNDIQSGRIRNPYLVMECNNPMPGLDATEDVDKKRNVYYPMATKCVVMNTGIKHYFCNEIQKKCVIIPNPVRNDLPLPYHGERRKTIVNFCRLNRQKNLPLLIEAFQIFHRDHPDYRLEIYGDGELKEELITDIRSRGLAANAEIFPFQADIHNRIKDCIMYVSSSNWEGFPNSVMEALSIGMPVISTNCDFGPAELIDNEVNGLLVEPGNAEEMAMAMHRIVKDDLLRETISRNAIETRKKYDVKIIGKQWLNLIESVGNTKNENPFS